MDNVPQAWQVGGQNAKRRAREYVDLYERCPGAMVLDCVLSRQVSIELSIQTFRRSRRQGYKRP
jgi:hypothetical protein